MSGERCLAREFCVSACVPVPALAALKTHACMHVDGASIFRRPLKALHECGDGRARALHTREHQSCVAFTCTSSIASASYMLLFNCEQMANGVVGALLNAERTRRGKFG